jgi:hypothetical protein
MRRDIKRGKMVAVQTCFGELILVEGLTLDTDQACGYVEPGIEPVLIIM